MPRYRPGARARKGKNASLTCICAPIVAGYCPRTSTILDQGPIDTCNLEVQTSKLQSIHCGLPASWTRARRHPPSSPSPVASRGGGRALAFLNWTRVQLDRPLARREASNMGVYAQLSSGPISLPTAVRTAYPAQRAWFGSRAARFAWDPTTIIRKRRFKVSRQVRRAARTRASQLLPSLPRATRSQSIPQPPYRFSMHHSWRVNGMKRVAILLSVGLLVGLGLLIAFAPTPRAGAQITAVAISEADAGAK